MGIMQAFVGSTYGDGVHITPVAVYDIDTAGNTATAGYRLNSNGNVETEVSGVFSFYETWIDLVANAGNYEVKATNVSGFIQGDSTGTWLGLSTSRHWYVQRNLVGVRVGILTIEIRDISSGVILASAGVDLTAEIV